MKQLTAEQVLPGHPDKLCDQISDAILDAHLQDDPYARVAVEALAASDRIILSGEITSSAIVDYEQVVRDTVRSVGYTAATGFDPDTIVIEQYISQQSPQIGESVDVGGAGDQGIIFGYATNEHESLMPTSWVIANELAKRLVEVTQEVSGLGPDGKTQATVSYDEDTGMPVSLDTVVLAVQHDESIPVERVRELVSSAVALPVAEEFGLDLSRLQVKVNTAGAWNLGGPRTDTGLTGRKIIADTYGGAARHGGGAFSGKDATKVDRSAAYAARQAARWVVSEGLADRCEVQLGYAIGVAEPVSVRVDTFGSGKVSDSWLAREVRRKFDFRPAAIIARLNLRQPIFGDTAKFGHFGDSSYSWEQ